MSAISLKSAWYIAIKESPPLPWRLKINGKNEVILADEISPDTCRLWDSITDKKLDKDRFRKDLGDLIPAYTEVAKRLGILHEQSNVSAVNVTKLSSVKKKSKWKFQQL